MERRTLNKMAKIERRSGEDRREAGRFGITVEIEWETSTGRKPGTVSDINQTGCFVLSSGNVTDGEPVILYLPLSDGTLVQFAAVVSNHVIAIGFAAKFFDLTRPQTEFLESFVAMYGGEG